MSDQQHCIDISTEELEQLQKSMEDVFLTLLAQEDNLFVERNKAETATTVAPTSLLSQGQSSLNFAQFCESTAQAIIRTATKKRVGTRKARKDGEDKDIDLVAEFIASRHDNEKQIQRKIEARRRGKTTGKAWFDLPATRVTDEVRTAFAVIQHRGQLTEAGHFVRTEKMKKLPKYFQLGTIIDNDPNSYENLSKKQKTRTLTDQFIEDARSKEGVVKKFKSLQDRNGTNNSSNNRKGKKAQYKHVTRR